MSTRTIEIENVGPVEAVSIPLPEGGGITVLHGGNDVGKTIALDAIGRTLGGKQPLTPRDGQPSKGSVVLGDVRLTIARSVTRQGEAAILSIEDRLAIAELVEPVRRGAETADQDRTKALCRLTGAQADESLFYDAVGGREVFDKVVTTGTHATDDLVEMARMVNRDFCAAARKDEDDATKASGEAMAAAESIKDIDLEGPCSATVLDADLEQAILAATDLRTRKTNADLAGKRAEEATEAVDRAIAGYTGPEPATAKLEYDVASEHLREATATEQQSQEAYMAARERTHKAQAAHGLAQHDLRAVEQHTATITAWQETIEAGMVTGPGDQEIVMADVASQKARMAVELGALIREGRIRAEKGKVAKAKASEHAKKAEQLRQAAQDTELVLADVVSAEGLTLVDGRWCTETDRGMVFFAERSRGTRAAIAIRLVAKRLRELGAGQALIGLPQELWESLDGNNRRMLARVCKELTINIVTAQADWDEVGELRAEVFDGSEKKA